MTKKLVLGPILAPKMFRGFNLYRMLDIVASYYCKQFQAKLMNQTWENGKKPSFGTHIGPFGPKNLFCEFYLY